MADIFLEVLNASITTSYLVVAVVLLRFALKKAPKWSVCLLWCMVVLRLIMPFTLESEVSLLPSAQPIVITDSAEMPVEVNTGIESIDNRLNDLIVSQNIESKDNISDNEINNTHNKNADTLVGKNNKSFSWLAAMCTVWIAVIVVMLGYGVVSYILINQKVEVCVPYQDNIYFCDSIETSFILGTIRPKIYIPSGIEAEHLDYVIKHEKAHLKRCDHLLKPFAFLLLSVHWFNPFVWLAYILLCRDIEGACDERVIEDENITDIVGYSTALLDCGVNRRMLIACPVAFGELSVKSRIKSVLGYKRPAYWLSAMSVFLSIALAFGFLTSPKDAIKALDTDNQTQNHTDIVAPDNNKQEDNVISKNEIETENNVHDTAGDNVLLNPSVNNNKTPTVSTPSVNVPSQKDPNTNTDTDNTVSEQTPSNDNKIQGNFVSPWPQLFYDSLQTPDYIDRLPSDNKIYRASLGYVQQSMYDKYLPYVLSYTPFYVDLGSATDYQWLSNVIGAIRADYPETAFYFGFSYYDDPLFERDWELPYKHCAWTEYFTIDCKKTNADNFNQQEVDNYIVRIESVCDEIIAKMPQNLSKKEKYQWLADYICDTTELYNANINPEQLADNSYQNADGPLLYGKGLPQAYSQAYQMLCQRAGLFAVTYYQTPEYTPTAWNVVVVDNGSTCYMNLSEADRTGNRSRYYFTSDRVT